MAIASGEAGAAAEIKKAKKQDRKKTKRKFKI